MRIDFELTDQPTIEKLGDAAKQEGRDPKNQAMVIVMKSLGTYQEYDPKKANSKVRQKLAAHEQVATFGNRS